MQTSKYTMVDYLDEPERILCFTVDEFMCLILPIGVGIQTHHGLLGFLAGLGMTSLIRKLKANDSDGLVQRLLYWYFPSVVNRLKHLPPSHVRQYMG